VGLLRLKKKQRYLGQVVKAALQNTLVIPDGEGDALQMEARTRGYGGWDLVFEYRFIVHFFVLAPRESRVETIDHVIKVCVAHVGVW
jgi:hypothetical protein